MAEANKQGGTVVRKWLGIGVVGVLMGLLVVNLISDTPPEEKEQVAVNDEQQRIMQATNFELPTMDGELVDLHGHHGKVVILNFWASWCQPCMQEAPHLQNFYKDHQQDVEILAINLTHKDDVVRAQQFVQDYQLTFPVLLDEEGEVSTMYGAFTIPTTIVLNREGTITKQIAGPVDEAYLQELVGEAL